MFKIRLGMFAAIGAALLLFTPASNATTYTFTGNCTDCTGTGVGTLTLIGYTEGTPILNTNFARFEYVSDLFSLSVSDFSFSHLRDITGSLGPIFPAAYNVSILTDPDLVLFNSATAPGAWDIGSILIADFGPTSSWDRSGAPAATPIPGALPLFATGLGSMGLLGWWRKRKAKRKNTAAALTAA